MLWPSGTQSPEVLRKIARSILLSSPQAQGSWILCHKPLLHWLGPRRVKQAPLSAESRCVQQWEGWDLPRAAAALKGPEPLLHAGGSHLCWPDPHKPLTGISQSRKEERKQLARVTQCVWWAVWLQSLSSFINAHFLGVLSVAWSCCGSGGPGFGDNSWELLSWRLLVFPPFLQRALCWTSQEHRAGSQLTLLF